MRTTLNAVYAGSGALAAICLAGIFIVMLAQSLGREVNVMVPGADDIVAWLCAASGFLALGHTFRRGELVRVGIWLDMLAGRRRRAAELFALVVTAVFSAYMAWAVTGFVLDSWKFGEVAQGMIRLPIWIPQSAFAAGVWIFLVAVLDELVAVLRNRKPSYEQAEEERRAAGDFSETV